MSTYIVGFILGWGACVLSYTFVALIRPHAFCANRHQCRIAGDPDKCDHCGRSLGVARHEITPDGTVVSVGVECRDCAEEQTA